MTADDFRTGTIAAAFGGTTTVIDFALHQKGDTLSNSLRTWHGKAEGRRPSTTRSHVMVGDMREDVMEEIPHALRMKG